MSAHTDSLLGLNNLPDEEEPSSSFRDIPTDPDPFDRGKVFDPIALARGVAASAFSKLSPGRVPTEVPDITLCCAFNLLAELQPSTVVARVRDSRVRLISHWRQLRRAEAAAALRPVEVAPTEEPVAEAPAAEVHPWYVPASAQQAPPPALELIDVPDSPLFAPEAPKPPKRILAHLESPSVEPAALPAHAASLVAEEPPVETPKPPAVVGLERFLRQVQSRTGQTDTAPEDPKPANARRMAKLLDGEYSSRFGRTGTE